MELHKSIRVEEKSEVMAIRRAKRSAWMKRLTSKVWKTWTLSHLMEVEAADHTGFSQHSDCGGVCPASSWATLWDAMSDGSLMSHIPFTSRASSTLT